MRQLICRDVCLISKVKGQPKLEKNFEYTRAVFDTHFVICTHVIKPWANQEKLFGGEKFKIPEDSFWSLAASSWFPK